MSPALAYVVGVLAVWTGFVFLLRAAAHGMIFATAPRRQRPAASRPLVISLVAAAALLLTGLSLTKSLSGPQWSAPLVWVVLPFYGWAAVACGVLCAVRIVQALLALSPVERLRKAAGAVAWLLVGGLFTAFWVRAGFEAQLLKGRIPLDGITLGAIASLSVLAVLAMAWADRRSRTRGVSKGLVAHLALLVGCVVFGLPFVYLLITSFKEDRDMVSRDGRIVWVPKVEVQVPYFDAKSPLYEGEFEGATVHGEIIERLPNGNARVDIFKPMSMRGITFTTPFSKLREIPKMIPTVTGRFQGKAIEGKVVQEREDGSKVVSITKPREFAGTEYVAAPSDVEPIRVVGLKWQNYPDALDFLPPEAGKGLVFLRNTLLIVLLSVVGTLLSSSIVAYAFSRMKFPGRGPLFLLLLSTMMLPAAVTLLPQFLIFRYLGWIDTLYPLWAPSFFASAFNVFLLRQFFMTIPMELEDAAKIDGSGYLNTFWSVMLPQIKPALAVIAIWTFMGAWNNFMGPLIYVNSPENMTIAYAVQLFQGARSGEPGLLMAFVTMSIVPVLALFFFAQRYFIEGVTLTGLGGR